MQRDGKIYPPMTTRADWLPAWLCRRLLREDDDEGDKEGKKKEVEEGVGYAGIEGKNVGGGGGDGRA